MENLLNIYLHCIDIHVLQHLRVSITAYVEHDILSIAGLELIDNVKIEKCLRDESFDQLTSFSREHMNERLIIEIKYSSIFLSTDNYVI